MNFTRLTRSEDDQAPGNNMAGVNSEKKEDNASRAEIVLSGTKKLRELPLLLLEYIYITSVLV